MSATDAIARLVTRSVAPEHAGRATAIRLKGRRQLVGTDVPIPCRRERRSECAVRRGCSLPISVVVLVITARLACAQAHGVQGRRIDHHNRLLLARARVEGKTDGIVLILTRPGSGPQVIERLRAFGAEVQAHFDEVGYLRVQLPLAHFAQVQALPDVIEARIDTGHLSYGYDQGTDPQAIKLAKRAAERAKAAFDTTSPPPPPLASVARRGVGVSEPYIPMTDMGTPQFTRAHPTYDGRGVTIGVVEKGVLDLTHPALQSARTLSGDSVPKIVGILTPSSFNPDPAPGRLAKVLTRDSVPDVMRVRCTGPVETHDGTFNLDSRTYHAPRPGHYCLGVYSGHQSLSGVPYAVLWDSAGRVWVDSNRDHDFRDERALGDFNRTHTIGSLGRDSTAATPVRSVPFAVTFDSGGMGLHLYEGDQFHMTMVASVATGRRLANWADASAPGARLIIVNAGWSLGDEIEGFIRAARDPRIDLITVSQAGETFPGAGESILALVLERLVHLYGKPIFASAGNTGPLLGLTVEPANAEGVISVGGYVSSQTYRAHYGWQLRPADWLLPYSARGPALDGAVKPDLAAPALSIAAFPCSRDFDNGRALVYVLPRCYMLAGGTSSAAPHAAGAAAVLLSAAKQAHVPHEADRLAWALRAGARQLVGYKVHEQGGGLIDVRRAWELLHSSIEVPAVHSVAPVRTRANPYLRQPGVGRGLYEREGWALGDSGTRTVTLTRSSGPAGNARYQLRWRGNDGTFAVPNTDVILPLNQPVGLRVHIAPATVGVHSAALQVVDRRSGVALYEVPTTVVAATQLTAANDYTVRLRGTAAWPNSVPFFVNVPPGTRALKVAMRVVRGRLHLFSQDPATLGNLTWESYFKGYRYPQSGNVYIPAGSAATELFPSPPAGVWELTAAPLADPTFGGDSAQYHVPAEVELVVSAVGSVAAGVRLAPDTMPLAGITTGVAGSQVGAPRAASEVTVEFSFSNRQAPLAGAVTVAELGTRRTVTGTVDSSNLGPMYDLNVEPGTTSLRVAVEPDADSPAVNPSIAHLDLYLYDCTTGSCFLWDADIVHESRAELLVRAPRAGRWKVVIDPAWLPVGTAGFTYTETMTAPSYGSVSIDTTRAAHSSGARWSATAHVRSAVTPQWPGDLRNRRELIVVADVVDLQSEAEEQARPLAVWGGLPYRPVVLGTAEVPID